MSCLSLLRSSKNITICSLKKTTGSTEGLPPIAYSGSTNSLTNERSSLASRRR